MRMRLQSRGTMSWIEEIEVSDADENLAEIYNALIEQRGKVSNILKVHSYSHFCV